MGFSNLENYSFFYDLRCRKDAVRSNDSSVKTHYEVPLKLFIGEGKLSMRSSSTFRCLWAEEYKFMPCPLLDKFHQAIHISRPLYSVCS